jgi:fibronectin type 3 domain-containing protein
MTPLWLILFQVTLIGPARQVTLDWTPSTSVGVVGYNVYRADTWGNVGDVLVWKKVNKDLVKDKSFIDKDVTSLMTYFYKMTAVDGDGVESDFSNTANAVMGPAGYTGGMVLQ